MIKAAIFDMGGVLLRTADAAPRQALAQRYGFSVEQMLQIIFASESSHRAERNEKSDTAHWDWALDQLRVPQPERQDFIRQWWAGDRMDYDLLAFINSLRPGLRTGLLSNAWPATRQNIQRHWGGLEQYFDVVVFSAEVGMRKPEPAFYQWMLEQLGVIPQETIFIDDLGENVEAAAKLGLGAIQFRSPEQARQEILAKLNHTVRG